MDGLIDGWIDCIYLKTLRKPTQSSQSSQSHKLDSRTSKPSELETAEKRRKTDFIIFPRSHISF